MIKNVDEFKILSGEYKTRQFLDTIRKYSDLNRNSLGFIRKGVFEEFVRRDEIFVLIKKCEDENVYIGHLLFSRRFPRAQIIQVFTREEYRRNGIGSMLIDHFTSVRLRIEQIQLITKCVILATVHSVEKVRI